MDTISRENNSMLPVVGVALGAVALIVGGIGIVNASKANKTLAADQPKIDRIDDLSNQITTAQAASDKATRDISSLATQTQSAVTQIGNDLASIHEQIKHMEEAHVRPAAKGGPKGEPAVAGPGEYIVKAGDTGMKIARANGCSLADLESVNPGVSWTHLKVGEKLKLPEKK